MKVLATIIVVLFFTACTKEEDADYLIQNKNVIPTVRSEATYNIIAEEGITYAEGLSHNTLNSVASTVMPLRLDAFIPDNDMVKRPILILIHGGGFSRGSRTDPNIVSMARYFAARGWVVFSIDYRMVGDKGTVPAEWIQFAHNNLEQSQYADFLKLYPAHRDVKAAVRWVVTNAAIYKTDADYITIGGGSAGAIAAITTGITNAEDYTNEIPKTIDPTLSTTNKDRLFTIKSILDFWGNDMAVEVLYNIYGYERFDNNDAPILIVHGTEDVTVPFSDAEELKNEYINTGVDYEFYPLVGFGHSAWNATVEGKSLEKLSFDFIVEQQNLSVE